MGIFLILLLTALIPGSAFAGAKGEIADLKAKEEAAKKAKVEELKEKLQTMIEMEKMRRAFESPARSESPKSAVLPMEGRGSAGARVSGAADKSALCGTYEQSESCRNAVEKPDADEEMEVAEPVEEGED